MKRILILLATIVVACTKPSEQEVRFVPSIVETGSMTRASDYNEILNLIESTYVTFPIDLYTNEETNTFTRMEFGRTYTVPIGTFKVIGYNSNLITMTGKPTSNYSLAKSPSFYTESYVDIQYGTTEYALPIEVRSAAIVFDRSEVGQIQYKGISGSYITISNSDLVFSDNYGLFFVNGYFQGKNQVAIKIVPKSGANKETEFVLSYEEVGTGSATWGKLEGGKFYVLHPNPVTELSGVSFSLNIPTWECGLD